MTGTGPIVLDEDAANVMKPLPPYMTARECLGRAMPAISEVERVSVVEAAQKYRRLSSAAYRGPFSYDETPYMRETVEHDVVAPVRGCRRGRSGADGQDCDHFLKTRLCTGS